MTVLTATAATTTLPAEPPEWIMLMPAGEVALNDGRGPFHNTDPAGVVRETKTRLGNRRMPLDFDHSEAADTRSGQPVPAAGWVTDLEARPDGVWARVEWTEAGAEAIRRRDYLYISPFFTYRKSSGQVTGIINAGLVKQPAIDMDRLAAAQAHPHPEDDMELEEQLRQALGLPEDADSAAIVAAATMAKTDATAAAERADKAEADLATAAASSAPDPAKFVPITDFNAVRDDLAALRTERAQEKAEAAVAAASEAGKIAPAQHDWAKAYASSDPDGFAAYVAGAPVIVAGGKAVASAQPPGSEGGLSAAEEQMRKSLGFSEDEWRAARPR